jgi:hypothetical protein
VKTPQEIMAILTRRLDDSWAETIAADTAQTAGREPALTGKGRRAATWPKSVSLGEVKGTAAASDFPALVTAVAAWREWAALTGAQLRWASRELLRTPQQVPTHLVLSSLDAAAELAGQPWVERIGRGRSHAARLATAYPHLLDAPESAEGSETLNSMHLVQMLRDVDSFTDTDFNLLCRAADWFVINDATGLTPRQVPIQGLHAKWLNTRRHLIRTLAGKTNLGLLETHPPRIHFTYLDPNWRAAGGRLNDSATVGDAYEPAYQPRTVIISENKDTALYFPELAQAISVEGVGRGGATAAAFDWLREAEHIFYWGDMDADGLEILNEFRAAGIDSVSILMDRDAYTTWHQFGTNTDAKSQPLTGRTPKSVPHLTDSEGELYLHLCDHNGNGFRRIEQERIPFSYALEAIATSEKSPRINSAARAC